MTDIVERLRKMATCIYIATEESVADDVSDGLRKAADEIERLQAALEAICALDGRHDLIDAQKIARAAQTTTVREAE